MKAIILAAGVASRLRPLTDNTPKCLLKLGGKTILGRTLDNLIKNGIKDFVFVTGYLREQIETFVKENYPEINSVFLFNEKYDSTNNIYSLWMTKKEVINDDVLLLDSDILFDSRIVKLLLESQYPNCLALKSGFELGEEEIKVTVNEDGSIKEISKVVEPKIAIGESIGIEKFSNDYVKMLFNELDEMIENEGLVNIFYEAAFERTLRKGAKIYPVDVKELKCSELDTVEDFKHAEENMVQGIE